MVHDVVLQHGVEVAHSPAVAEILAQVKTSSMLGTLENIGSLKMVGHTLQHWAHAIYNHLPIPSVPFALAASAHDQADGDVSGPRMVEYFSKSCPHCTHLEPIWQDAKQQWLQQHSGSSGGVAWLQKECYTDGWKPGRDFAECQQQNVHGFPTIKFYGGSAAAAGDDFLEDRTAAGMVDFVKAHIGESPAHSAGDNASDAVGAAAVGADQGPQIVEYLARSCPHCQHLQPVWEDASQQWEQAGPHIGSDNIKWVQKECFGEGWKPGHDFKECEKAGLEGFPTIKFYGGNASAHGDEYEGARTADGILEFAKSHIRKHSVGDHAAAAVQGEPRIVDFFAKDCPHCQHLQPVWDDAAKQYTEAHKGDDQAVNWSQKECFGAGWAKGKDFEECSKEGINSFPTIKFYGGSAAKPGDEYEGERTASAIMDFANAHVGKKAAAQAAQEAASTAVKLDHSGPRVVEYFAKDCPHCKHLEPVWDDAKQQWLEQAKAHPEQANVVWDQKECFGEKWAKGKDYAECKAEGVHGFPTIKFFGGNAAPDGDRFTDKREAENLVEFAKAHLSKDGGQAASASAPEGAPPVPAPVQAIAPLAPAMLAVPPMASASRRSPQQRAACNSKYSHFL